MSKADERHKQFVIEYFKSGLNATKAYMSVYGPDITMASAAECGSKLLRNTNIIESIDKHKKELNEEYGLLKDATILRLRKIIFDDSSKDTDVTKAIVELNKMLGNSAETRNINVSGDLKNLLGFDGEDNS